MTPNEQATLAAIHAETVRHASRPRPFGRDDPVGAHWHDLEAEHGPRFGLCRAHLGHTDRDRQAFSRSVAKLAAKGLLVVTDDGRRGGFLKLTDTGLAEVREIESQGSAAGEAARSSL